MPTPHHQAAAVLAAFDPDTLVGWGDAPPARQEDLRRLLADSTPVPDGGGAGRWSLASGPRRRALRAFRSRLELRQALTLNRRAENDDLQKLLDGYIAGSAPDAGTLDETGLALAIQVVGWLRGIPAGEPLELPDLDSLRRRLDLLRLINPIRAMVGNHFRGRKAEIGRIRAYLDGPGGHPLMIWGVGGTGKSTLAAKVALDLLTDHDPAPVAYLDFDRKLLVPEEPASLLLEAVRQLNLQTPVPSSEADALSRLLRSDLEARLPTSAPDEALDTAALLSGSTGANRMARLADFLGSIPSWRGRPLLVVLDTFEQVQYRSTQTVGLLWQFLGMLLESVPQTRAIVAGRTPFEGPEAELMELKGLDQEAAVACLTALGVPAEVAPFVFSHVGGNPLALRLAAEVAKREPLPSLIGYLGGEELGDRLREELVQGYLLRRILGHIHDPDVRKLAHPGLVLRQITPDLIREVLAGPCEIQVPDQLTAEHLWRELARETSLVIQESGAVLRHRPEVRREMIDLLRASKRGQVAAIHQAAVAYYSRFEDDAARTEELYHRLSLEQPAHELDARWRSSAEPSLRSAVDELAPSAMAYLASRARGESGAGFEAPLLRSSFWRDADLRVWERKTASWVRDLMRQDRLEEALEALHEREERSPASPLFLLEGRVLQRLGHESEASSIVGSALEDWPPAADAGEQVDLLLLHSGLLERLGRLEEARRSAEQARQLLSASARPSQLLEAAAAEARLVNPGREQAAARDRLAETSAELTERDLAAIPGVARRAAAELLSSHPQEASRILKITGLGALGPAEADRLAPLLSEVPPGSGRKDVEVESQDVERPPSVSTRGIASSRDLAFGLVERLDASQTAPLEADLAVAAGEILRGDEDAARRRSTSHAASLLRSNRVDERATVVDALIDTFDREDLEALAFDIGENPSLIRPSATKRERVFQLVDWAEMQGRLNDLLAAVRRVRPDSLVLAELASPSAAVPAGALRLRASQVDELSQILSKAFPDTEALVSVLCYRLNRSFKHYKRGSSYGAQGAREVVDYANREGWSGPLLAAAREARPSDSDLYRFVEAFGLAAMRPEDDREVRGALQNKDIDAWRSRLAALEAQLCLVAVEHGSSSTYGTGLLVGPDLMLTAGRALGFSSGGGGSVLGAQQQSVSLIFDFKQLDNGEVLNRGNSFRLARQWLVAAGPADSVPDDEGPDYALLRVEGEPGRRPIGWPRTEPGGITRGWCRSAAADWAPRDFAPICMLYYAAPGRPAKFSLARKGIIWRNDRDPRVGYRIGAGLGAAGAPLLDENMNLVGIHQGALKGQMEGSLLSAILRDLRNQGNLEAIAAFGDG